VKTLDMPLRYWNNFNDTHRTDNVLIVPLAQLRRNNYLGCSPPTTD
jgi:hypothetical protein